MLPLPAAIDLSLAALPPAWMVIQSMAAGAIVGLSLGLTGRREQLPAVAVTPRRAA